MIVTASSRIAHDVRSLRPPHGDAKLAAPDARCELLPTVSSYHPQDSPPWPIGGHILGT